MERSSSRRDASSSPPPPPPPPLGFRSWLLLLLFSLLLLLFFPSFISSSSRGSRPFAIRNGWDALYLLLVLFAILCGVLSRRSGDGDDPEEWLGVAHHRVQGSYSHQPTVQASPGAGVLRLRSGGSYPLLRQDGATLDAGGSSAPGGWHRYDDSQLYRQSVESGGWERERAADFEPKMIAVDTYVPRKNPSPRSRSPPSPQPPPPQPPPTGKAVDELPVRGVEKNEIFESQNPHSPPSSLLPEHPSQRQPWRRRRKAEKVPSIWEVDKDEIFASESRSPSRPPPTQRQRRRRSIEKISQDEEGQNATFKEKDTPLQASATPRYRRRSVGDIPKREVDQDPSLGLQRPHASPPASPPSPPPAIPSPQPEEEEEEKKRHKNRSSGGAKDIAAAIALFYPKKKWSKPKRSSNDTTPRGEEPASSAPPPPPPPPLPPPPPPHSSVFDLFSQKKGGSKNRRIHSDSASAQPPTPSPSVLTRQSREQVLRSSPATTRQSREQVLHSSLATPSPPPPAPPSHNWNDKGEEKVHLNESSPLPPSSSLPPRPEKSNLSSPFPPRPPHRPSSKHHPISEEEMAAALRSRGDPEEEEAAMMKFKERESKEREAVSCPSPDVDDKADLFIARCHANWKLEKQNSMRDKERRKQRKESKRA